MAVGETGKLTKIHSEINNERKGENGIGIIECLRSWFISILYIIACFKGKILVQGGYQRRLGVHLVSVAIIRIVEELKGLGEFVFLAEGVFILTKDTSMNSSSVLSMYFSVT